MSGPYRILGISLALAGAIFAPLAYVVMGSVPLTSTGITAVMLGVIIFALANTRPPVSPEACRLMLETGMENTARLVEELGLEQRAVYLPPAAENEPPQALIPLAGIKSVPRAAGKLPGRLIVRYGKNPEDMAVAVSTPGGMIINMLETGIEPTASGIESGATHILAGILDIADSVTVSMADGRIVADIGGARLDYKNIWYYRCLGSPAASILAAICAAALGKPVSIKEESRSKGNAKVIIEVLP